MSHTIVSAQTSSCSSMHCSWLSKDGFESHSVLPKTPVGLAAALTRSALLFRRAFKQGKIEPDTVKGGALCMDSWRCSTSVEFEVSQLILILSLFTCQMDV